MTKISDNPYIIHLLHQSYKGWQRVILARQYMKISIIMIIVIFIIGSILAKRIDNRFRFSYSISIIFLLILMSVSLEFLQAGSYVFLTGGPNTYDRVVDTGYLDKYQKCSNTAPTRLKMIKSTLKKLSQLKKQHHKLKGLQQNLINLNYYKTHTKNIQHYKEDVKRCHQLSKECYSAKKNYFADVQGVKYVINIRPPRVII